MHTLGSNGQRLKYWGSCHPPERPRQASRLLLALDLPTPWCCAVGLGECASGGKLPLSTFLISNQLMTGNKHSGGLQQNFMITGLSPSSNCLYHNTRSQSYTTVSQFWSNSCHPPASSAHMRFPYSSSQCKIAKTGYSCQKTSDNWLEVIRSSLEKELRKVCHSK